MRVPCVVRACVRGRRFMQRPEYVPLNSRFVFREGRTKGIGIVIGTQVGGPGRARRGGSGQGTQAVLGTAMYHWYLCSCAAGRSRLGYLVTTACADSPLFVPCAFVRVQAESLPPLPPPPAGAGAGAASDTGQKGEDQD